MLGIMHGLYDESQPQITTQQEGFAKQVAARLAGVADVIFPGAAKSRAAIEDRVRKFNTEGYDGIMIVMLLYSPGFRLIKALRDNRLPILLANIQPIPSVTTDWDWSRLTTNQGIHGAQDTGNMLLHAGARPAVITEDWQSDAFPRFVEDWARAAKTVTELGRMHIACFSRMKGMGDIVGNDEAMLRVIGPEVFFEGIGEVYRRMEKVTDKEIDRQIAEDGRSFAIDPRLPKENHRYAARLQLGLEKFMEDGGYDGYSANFDVFREDGRFTQIPMLAASNLMAKGYAYSNEGDVHTAALVGAGHVIAGNGHFTEMYSLDFARDSALMSHMEEGNWRTARTDRPIRLIDRPLEIGGLSNPPTLVFSAQPGPATLVSLVPLDAGYRLVALEGEILDTEEHHGIPMPYFHIKPDTGIRRSMDDWIFAGGTHHQALVLGRHARRWKMLCGMLGIGYTAVYHRRRFCAVCGSLLTSIASAC